ncbi:glycosyltransferase family 4 protein [Pseudomonas sp. SIMBA_077]
MTLWLALPFVCIACLCFTAGLRKYALASNLIDVPNARSSHSVPTPRGGGVAIVCVFLMTALYLAFSNVVEWSLAWVFVVSGGGVAILGFLDDHGHIAARWRLLGHFSASILAVFLLGGLPEIVVFDYSVNLAWLGSIFAVLYLVWMLNLYNFMDGIDGLASVEAICVCCGAAFVAWLSGYPELIWLPLLLAATVAGFLYWNFPPARIFMGDAGSGFLGITLGILSLQASWVNSNFIYVWLILMGVFIVDATMTLFRRLLRGDKVYEAHRSHAYQFASRHFGSHRVVTLAVCGINIFWLLPWAVSVVVLGVDGMTALLLAYVPLLVVALKFNAGGLEK